MGLNYQNFVPYSCKCLQWVIFKSRHLINVRKNNDLFMVYHDIWLGICVCVCVYVKVITLARFSYLNCNRLPCISDRMEPQGFIVKIKMVDVSTFFQFSHKSGSRIDILAVFSFSVSGRLSMTVIVTLLIW